METIDMGSVEFGTLEEPGTDPSDDPSDEPGEEPGEQAESLDALPEQSGRLPDTGLQGITGLAALACGLVALGLALVSSRARQGSR